MSQVTLGQAVWLNRGRGHFIEYLLDREDVRDAWTQHTHHKFVAALADGTLPLESFKYYLIQDYLYLVRCCQSRRWDIV